MSLRLGVVGIGRLGRQHVRVFSAVDGVSFVGCHDAVGERSRSAADEFGATHFEELGAMLSSVDAVSIVVPTTSHCEIARQALEMGKDVFVEKPIAASVEEAEQMIADARRFKRVLQVGHVERFNGALQAVLADLGTPSFIEVDRLSPFSVRGTDVSVVGDLMIHDLDLLNTIVGEWPCDIRVKGAGVLTQSPDIVNVRFEYENGCVANVTASRVSVTPVRKLRIFSPSQYVSIDLLKGHANSYRKADGYDRSIQMLDTRSAGYDRLNLTDFIKMETIRSDGEEPLVKELIAFCNCVTTGGDPVVSGEDGARALRLAVEVVNRIAPSSRSG